MVESRRQAGGRNGGLQGRQRVRHVMFEEAPRSQSLLDGDAASLIARSKFPGRKNGGVEMRAQERCRHYIRTQYLITAGGV
jgi:hypothetical protein